MISSISFQSEKGGSCLNFYFYDQEGVKVDINGTTETISLNSKDVSFLINLLKERENKEK